MSIRDLHQTLSRKIGFRHAKAGLPQRCPWWADRLVYAIAYLEGKGVKITSDKQTNQSANDHS